MARDSESLNALQAAAFLGAHVQTVRRLARSGELPSFKVGKDWRFRKEALIQWEESQRKTPAQDKATPTLRSVLVIDDEELVRKAIARMVKKMGFRVRQASSGATGLAEVARNEPDLVLLDLVMPGMSGTQFLAALRETHPNLPVAIVTGYPDSELMRQAMRHAPILLLEKPIDPALLRRTLQTLSGVRGTVGSPETGGTLDDQPSK